MGKGTPGFGVAEWFCGVLCDGVVGWSCLVIIGISEIRWCVSVDVVGMGCAVDLRLMGWVPVWLRVAERVPREVAPLLCVVPGGRVFFGVVGSSYQ